MLDFLVLDIDLEENFEMMQRLYNYYKWCSRGVERNLYYGTGKELSVREER